MRGRCAFGVPGEEGSLQVPSTAKCTTVRTVPFKLRTGDGLASSGISESGPVSASAIR